jgi:hypothetical protein
MLMHLGRRSSNEMSKSASAPLARSDERLVVEELENELLVYDLDNDRAHCLSTPAAAVWRRCDGETTVEDLGEQLDMDADTTERALNELRACALLEDTAIELVPSSNGQGAALSTRREMTLNVVKVGAAAATIPLIVSVVAPPPAAALTPTDEECFNASGCSQGCGACDCLGCCCCEPGGGFKKECITKKTCEGQKRNCSKVGSLAMPGCCAKPNCGC